jgi:hypothetical protein
MQAQAVEFSGYAEKSYCFLEIIVRNSLLVHLL